MEKEKKLTLDRMTDAKHLSVPVDILDRVHKLRQGPEAVRIGRRRVYLETKLQEWLDRGGKR